MEYNWLLKICPIEKFLWIHGILWLDKNFISLQMPPQDLFTYTKILVYLVGKSWNLIFMLFFFTYIILIGFFIHDFFTYDSFYFVYINKSWGGICRLINFFYPITMCHVSKKISQFDKFFITNYIPPNGVNCIIWLIR